MYTAIQDMDKNKKPLITLHSGKTTEIVAVYAKMLTHTTQLQMLEPKPIPLSDPFTWKEIFLASLRLNNNKSPDNNGLQAEYIKYAPEDVHQDIENQLNEVAETGTYAQELKHGLIIPIQKPGKHR